MRILEIYKRLEDLVIFEKDDGSIGIRALFEDKGTEEERELIRQQVMSAGFQAKNSVTFNTEPKTPKQP